MRDESLVRTIPKKEFPPGVKVGGQLEGHTDDGQPHVFHVMKIKGDTVHLDGNHPLAGKELRFAIKVTGVRAASDGRDRASPRARRARAPPLTPGGDCPAHRPVRCAARAFWKGWGIPISMGSTPF